MHPLSHIPAIIPCPLLLLLRRPLPANNPISIPCRRLPLPPDNNSLIHQRLPLLRDSHPETDGSQCPRVEGDSESQEGETPEEEEEFRFGTPASAIGGAAQRVVGAGGGSSCHDVGFIAVSDYGWSDCKMMRWVSHIKFIGKIISIIIRAMKKIYEWKDCGYCIF